MWKGLNPVCGKADIEHKSNFENLFTGNGHNLAYTVNCIVSVNFAHYFNFIAHDVYKNVQVKLHVYFLFVILCIEFHLAPMHNKFC